MTNPKKTNKTRWHRLFGTLLEHLLTPTGISVQCDIKVMTNPPEADILLIRRKTPRWTKQQRKLLADGIRDSQAKHILLEFKYTESVNATALQQTLSYDFFYKRSNHLTEKQVQSFIISAKTPRPETLKKLGFIPTKTLGIYKTEQPLLEKVTIIVLNELTDQLNNAWIKCFASQKQQKQKAFALLNRQELKLTSNKLEFYLTGLWKHWFEQEEKTDMQTELTPEQVMRIGEFWGESYLSRLEAEKFLPYIYSKKILGKIDPADILSQVDHKKILDEMDVKERLAGLKTKEILSEIDHKKIIAELEVEERLTGLSREEVEAYFQQIEK
jgi:hypothetical protein